MVWLDRAERLQARLVPEVLRRRISWYGVIDLSAARLAAKVADRSRTYTARPARALYPYTAASDDELSFEEETTLAIVEQTDESWWKAEKDGIIGLVPAAYFELSQ